MNTTPPPGWYPDNHGGGQRYWDGQQWTQHTAPGIREPHDREQPGFPVAPIPSPKSVPQTNWIVRHKVISGLAAFVLIAAVGGALAGEDDSPVAAASETTAEAPDISSPDVTPIAEAEPVDSDGDGVADQDDFDPEDAQIQTEDDVDTDRDGVPDYQDYRPRDHKIQSRDDVDTDRDGVPDYRDDFPRNSQYSKDTDGDGVADAIDDFPRDERYSQDSDGDGVADSKDVFPADPSRSRITSAMQNAMDTADSYLDYSAFSRSGLIGQLEFEGYRTEDATFAVDYLKVDWNEQAFKSAKSYLDYTSFSLSGLIGQLQYEGFTYAQAAYGANKAY